MPVVAAKDKIEDGHHGFHKCSLRAGDQMKSNTIKSRNHASPNPHLQAKASHDGC